MLKHFNTFPIILNIYNRPWVICYRYLPVKGVKWLLTDQQSDDAVSLSVTLVDLKRKHTAPPTGPVQTRATDSRLTKTHWSQDDRSIMWIVRKRSHNDTQNREILRMPYDQNKHIKYIGLPLTQNNSLYKTLEHDSIGMVSSSTTW